jgi:glycosyltransferase involved in cell wall biosynthesis
MVETHKNLYEMLDGEKSVLKGFTTLDLPGEKYRENSYLSSDPLLSQDLVSLADIDLALLLDLNLAFSFRDLLILKRTKRLPVVCLIHDIIPILKPEWFYGDPDWNKRTFREFLQKSLAVADHLVVTSNKVKRDIESLGWNIKATIHQIGLGAPNIVENHREQPDDIPTLLYLSTIEPRKGHMDLLEAFEILQRKGVKIRLVLVGRAGWLFKDIVERIKNNPDYGTYLFWHSNLSDADLSALYGSTTMSVNPSLDEGFGLSIEESLARKVIVLARRIPVFEERPNPNVYYFDGNPTELAAAILENVEKEWIPLEENAIRTMKDFALDLKGLIESI